MATINNYCLAPPERRQKWYVSGVSLRERDAWAIGSIDGYRPRFLVKAEKCEKGWGLSTIACDSLEGSWVGVRGDGVFWIWGNSVVVL